MATLSKHDHFNVQLSQAKQLHREGKLDVAHKQYEKLLKRYPGNHKLLCLLGGLLLQQKEYSKAVPHLKHACGQSHEDADLPYNLALAYYHLKEYENAVQAFAQAITMNDSHDRAYYMMAKAYLEWDEKKYREQAFNAYVRDIELTDRLDSHVMVADILYNLGRLEDARGVAKRALELDSSNEIALWVMAKTMIKENYRKSYMDLRHAEPIIKAGNLILQLHPNSWRGHHVLAEALAMIGEDALSIVHYEKLNKLMPGFASTRTSAAVLKLRQGRLKEGWEEIGQRKAFGTQLFGINTKDFDECPAPQWQGELIAGKKLLIASEQGIGDQILQAQLLRDLLIAGMEVHMTCTPKIVPLMQRSIPAVRFYSSTEGVPQDIRNSMDFKADLLDLGKYLRDDMSRFGEPFYFLKPKPDLVEHFRGKYAQFGDKLKIGIAWKSNSKSVGDLKSTELTQWKYILSVPGVQFINIQYGDIAADVEKLKNETGLTVFVDDFDPFVDIEKAVAQVAALDMVVSVSNAAVHFSGQLNIPSWVLLNQRTLWHWFGSGDTTVWYESMRLYRQEQTESWDPVFGRVAHDLNLVVADYFAQMAGDAHD